MSKYDLEKILPHKKPMVFLDDILDYDLEKLTLCAVFKVNNDKILFDKSIDGINSLAGIEFMAQAIGCFSYFKEGKNEPKPGLLLGTRVFNNKIEKFENGKEYRVEVKESFFDSEIYAFDCKISDDENNEVQNACIKVFKNDNIEEFIG